MIGFVLVNVLYGLFYYIDRLANKMEEPKVRPLWFVNALLIALMAVVVLGWHFGAAEKRNVRIRDEIETMDIGGQSVSSPLNE